MVAWAGVNYGKVEKFNYYTVFAGIQVIPWAELEVRACRCFSAF